MTYQPKVGHHIKVADKANWYNGREAVVVADHGEGIYSVAVGNVTFCLNRAQMREIKYAE